MMVADTGEERGMRAFLFAATIGVTVVISGCTAVAEVESVPRSSATPSASMTAAPAPGRTLASAVAKPFRTGFDCTADAHAIDDEERSDFVNYFFDSPRAVWTTGAHMGWCEWRIIPREPTG